MTARSNKSKNSGSRRSHNRRKASHLLHLTKDINDNSLWKSINTNKEQAHQKRRTVKERKLREAQVFNGGPWSQKERLDFLRGLRKFGPGKWKKIQTILTTRSNIQIKSHGQKILQRMNVGHDVYSELDEEEANGASLPIPGPTVTKFSSVASMDEDDTYSIGTASTSLSTAPPSSEDENDGDDEEEEDKEGSKNDEQFMPNYQSFDAPTPRKTNVSSRKSCDRTHFYVDSNEIVVKSPAHCQTSKTTLSLDEANVVLALFDLSKNNNLSKSTIVQGWK